MDVIAENRRILRLCFAMLACCLVGHGDSAEPERPDASRPPAEHSGLWKWSPSQPHHASVVMLRVGKAIGTGVILYVDKDTPQGEGYLGFCATANHVVEMARKEEKEIQILFPNTARDIARDCSVVRQDKDVDIAVVWCWVPKDVPAAKLASKRAQPGDAVEFVGLGGKLTLDQGMRHFHGTASAPTEPELIYADQTLLPGDSGGPIFNRHGRLLGVISGGWFWWSHERIEADSEYPLRATWPARGSNLIPLARLIARLPSDELGNCTASPSKRKMKRDENGQRVAMLPVPHRQSRAQTTGVGRQVSAPVTTSTPPMEVFRQSLEGQPVEVLEGTDVEILSIEIHE